jgi:hypothetical protein
MQILQYQDKGTHINAIAWFFIYAEFSKNTHLNDKHYISPNKNFEALLKPHKTPPPHHPIPKTLSEKTTPTCLTS